MVLNILGPATPYKPAATDTKFAPWFIVPSDDKRRARLNCINFALSVIRYPKLQENKEPSRQPTGKMATIKGNAKGQAFFETKILAAPPKITLVT